MNANWLDLLINWTLQNSLDGAILFVLVFVVLFAVRFKVAPQLRIALLVIVGLRFFLPVAPESPWSLRGLLPAASYQTETGSIGEIANRSLSSRAESIRAVDERAMTVVVGDASRTVKPMSLQSGLIPIVWLTGFLLFILVAGLRWGYAARRVSLLRKYSDPEGIDFVTRTGFPKGIKVMEAATGEGVAVFGLFRVTHLILPRDFLNRYGEQGARGILRHEMEHIRGRDLLWNWVILFLQCWHWFNPTVWIVGRLYRNEREIMCDQFALRNESESVRQTYGSTLIKALEAARFRQSAPSLISFISRKNELKQRLELIMKNKPYQMMIQLCVVAVIAAISISSFTSPQSFAAEEKDGDRNAKAEKRDGDAKKEGARDGDKRREGPRDGDVKKEGPRDGDVKKEGPRDGDKPKAEGEGAADKPANAAAMRTKEGKIFTTYDKDKDNHVSAEEIEGMMEGKQNSRGRREIRKAVGRSDRDENGKLDFEEFKFWLTVGRSDEKAEFR